MKVPVRRDTWDLDLAAIEAAITERTRMVIVNSPNNPTGRIYPPETLERLGEILRAASGRNGRAVYLLSDESYSRIVYDGRDFPTPTRFYADSFLIYTYGKTLLTPGTRVGYVALPPEMPEREEMRGALFLSSVANGWQFPNAVALHALPDFEHLSIDIPQLQRRRDKVVPALQEAGYETHSPEGTFYLLVKAPWENDLAFTELLAEQDVFVLPGSLIDSPGYFRVSLTASDEMVERGLPGFAAAMEKAKATTEPPKSEMAGVGTTRTTPSPGPQSGPACFA